MNPIATIEVVMWALATFAYFHVWGVGATYHESNPPELSYGSWYLSALQSLVVTLPIVLGSTCPNIMGTPYWNVLVPVAIATILAPIAFPAFNVWHPERTWFQTAANWVFERFNIALKKATVLIPLTGIFALVAWIIPSTKFLSPLYSPGYFGAQGLVGPSSLTMAALIMATFNVLLRSSITLQLSKILALVFIFISYGLLGYAADLSSSVTTLQFPLTTVVLLVVIIDFVIYIWSQIDR